MAQQTENGFTAFNTVNNAFQYVDNNNNVLFRVANDGSLQLGRNDNGSNVNRFIDFHSGSHNTDFDARIEAVGGGSADNENAKGNFEFKSSKCVMTGGVLDLGTRNSSAVVPSIIDFHSSGEDTDFDGRLTFFGGNTGTTTDGKGSDKYIVTDLVLLLMDLTKDGVLQVMELCYGQVIAVIVLIQL